jgi:Ca2+-transporting ATPase
VFDACTHTYTTGGAVVALTPEELAKLEQAVESFQHQAMRTIALAFRDFEAAPEGGWGAKAGGGEDAPALAETGCTLLAVVGIEDPLRPTVVGAIQVRRRLRSACPC